MTFNLHLNDEYFALVKSGHKSIEMRLLDEKRRAYKVGDDLIFTHAEHENLKLKVKIKALHKFKNFSELYKNLDNAKLGYLPNQKADPHDMENFYPLSEQNKFGVVGIEFELV